MTLEEFIDEVLGAEAKDYNDEEIGEMYDKCTGLFNVFFEKWKKEIVLKNAK